MSAARARADESVIDQEPIRRRKFRGVFDGFVDVSTGAHVAREVEVNGARSGRKSNM